MDTQTACGKSWSELPPGGALVLGGDYRALGAVRSLGRHGIPVWVLTDDHLIAGTSRYVRRRLAWPNGGDAARLAFLCDLAQRHGLDGWVVFPSGDQAAALIARNHAVLAEYFRLTTPPWEMLQWAYDKRSTNRLADETGVDTPWTCQPASREEVADLDVLYPVLLKPAYKKTANAFTNSKAWRVEDRETLIRRYDEACSLVEPQAIMIQGLIPGGGESQFSYAALCREGKVLASITARRTRQYPLDFGQASTYVESIENPEVEELSRNLLEVLCYDGLIEVEYKYDRRDRRYKLLDLNPRIWGWHTLGARAGVDFTYLQWLLTSGQPVPVLRARPGVRWVRMSTDVPAVIAGVRSGRLSLRQYLRSLRPPLTTAIFAADDIGPSVLDGPLLIGLALKRKAARWRTAADP
jgi:predicted ATP-grasp superfamily ATP-dependent carboligase